MGPLRDDRGPKPGTSFRKPRTDAPWVLRGPYLRAAFRKNPGTFPVADDLNPTDQSLTLLSSSTTQAAPGAGGSLTPRTPRNELYGAGPAPTDPAPKFQPWTHHSRGTLVNS